MTDISCKSNNSEKSSQTSSSSEESFEASEKFTLIKEIGSLLDQLITDEIKESKDKYRKTLFKQRHSLFSMKKSPLIDIESYLKRINKYLRLDDSTLILALIYIDRYCTKTKSNLTHLNIHKVLFTSVLEAFKFNQDHSYSTEFYSKVAGISVKEIIEMEADFLNQIEYKLFVNEKEFNTYEKSLHSAE